MNTNRYTIKPSLYIRTWFFVEELDYMCMLYDILYIIRVIQESQNENN